MNRLIKIHALALLLCSMIQPLTVQAEALGRLFMTQEQRIRLEQIRNYKPQPAPQEVAIVEEPEPLTDADAMDTELPEVVLEEEPVLTGPLTLKGVVKRDNGKNTAWLNDTNSLDGEPVSEAVNIHETDISDDSVRIKLPDNVTEITLKVGQTYAPEHETVQDVTDN